MNIESWCQVEGNSNQQWTRATRRHNPEAFTSTAFEQEQASKGRVVWAMANKPAQQSLARKKSFPQKCECISGLKRTPSFTTIVMPTRHVYIIYTKSRVTAGCLDGVVQTPPQFLCKVSENNCAKNFAECLAPTPTLTLLLDQSISV